MTLAWWQINQHSPAFLTAIELFCFALNISTLPVSHSGRGISRRVIGWIGSRGLHQEFLRGAATTFKPMNWRLPSVNTGPPLIHGNTVNQHPFRHWSTLVGKKITRSLMPEPKISKSTWYGPLLSLRVQSNSSPGEKSEMSTTATYDQPRRVAPNTRPFPP
jgi:hypothetical protein